MIRTTRTKRVRSGPAADYLRHDRQWRDPQQVVGLSDRQIDPRLMACRASAGWWDLLQDLGITLLVSREYEHFVIALSAPRGKPQVSHLMLPHPSGIAVDRRRRELYIASTRNPNAVYKLAEVAQISRRRDMPGGLPDLPVFIPVKVDFYPGSLYLHDLSLIAGKLYGTATGENCVVELLGEGRYKRRWWPASLEAKRSGDGDSGFDRNYLQLNSVAAGTNLRSSFFSASSAKPSRLRPGSVDYPVDRRGVVFSGETRQPVARGLTRPHSARLLRGALWVANSGYGEVGRIAGGRFEALVRLNGWTRGLCRARGVLFAGVSRVLPRFAHYAPGVDMNSARCGIYALEPKTGRVIESIIWERGNQIFAVEWLDGASFPFAADRRSIESERKLFYAFR